MTLREIKFRVWDSLNKKFWYLDKADILHGERDFCTYPYELSGDVALQQYTGLKDAKGAEIYEGDIIKTEFHFHKKIWNSIFYTGEFTLAPLETSIRLEEVKWGIVDGDMNSNTLGWVLGSYSLLGSVEDIGNLLNNVYIQYVFHTVEVVGNVFETPELPVIR